eukprot:scaffold5127_cov64-Phaeocystis_antarctica.AAC.3
MASLVKRTHEARRRRRSPAGRVAACVLPTTVSWGGVETPGHVMGELSPLCTCRQTPPGTRTPTGHTLSYTLV